MKTILKIGLLCSFVLAGTGCKTEPGEEKTLKTVGIKTQVISETDYVAPVRCTGLLATKMESKLSFKTGGIINRILADEGQSVSKGELLAELNLEEIRSQVQQAELVLKKSERDFKRAENLYRDSVATLEQYENARTALEVAKANDRIARFNLRYSAITAPADGKILKRIAEASEMIAPGHPVFLFASTQNEWVVRANLTDRDVIRVQMLDSAEIRFDAYRDEVFTGLISEIGTASDPYTGTYEVEIQLVRKPEKLVSGLMARLNIFPRESRSRILIPFDALVEATGFTGYVYLVEDGKPRKSKIRIETFTDAGIVVGEGLKPGDEIVIEGMHYLDEDSRIEISETIK